MSTLQKIVTFIATSSGHDDVQALTVEEFTNNGEFDEWVWHMAPSKEAAIARHDEAFMAWDDGGQDEGFLFIHEELASMSIADQEGTFLNEDAHRFGPATKKVQIVLEVALDMVPGWGDNPQDHIEHIFRSSRYVTAARVVEEVAA